LPRNKPAKRPQIRFLCAIFVPEDETSFYLYQSPSADAVRDAATRARLRFERITQAVSITPHRSAADPDGLGHRTHRFLKTRRHS